MQALSVPRLKAYSWDGSTRDQKRKGQKFSRDWQWVNRSAQLQGTLKQRANHHARGECRG